VRAILRSAGAAGRKSATAAAMTRASNPARPVGVSTSAASAASIAAAVSARTTATPSGMATASIPATSVTRAPRSRAASQTAIPIVPVLRLPMKRTGSIGSAVPPAVTTTWRPARSSASRPKFSASGRRGGRSAGSGFRMGRAPIASTAASTIRSSAARRPTPTWPEARPPVSGSTIR
jgi:hypothetical protein